MDYRFWHQGYEGKQSNDTRNMKNINSVSKDVQTILSSHKILEKKLQHRYFPVNTAKFYKNIYFLENLSWVLNRRDSPTLFSTHRLLILESFTSLHFYSRLPVY